MQLTGKKLILFAFPSIGVLWGFRERDELLENGAKYIIKEPKELLDIIKELNQ